ncbi:uncharacterized protein BJ171DRAFT_605840 [Polychytrium aggregatum]|uniref:uncharacterized protein n=1 Tax=Polychytrium aggregatum TaxID=110093 RepID=UPI0022FE27A4|nr:uncharacterized protein BJ171DRAFT_605840 [Polychytrium aggregatum]KAI9192911.1 hypothetical protein BJ171DRAFT_605840 [Polychytrium aggregatum]
MRPGSISTALIVSLSAVSVSASAPVFMEGSLLQRWRDLRSLASEVDLNHCMLELVTTYDEADSIYNKTGITSDFVNYLSALVTVSGDVPDTADFRGELNDISGEIQMLNSLSAQDPSGRSMFGVRSWGWAAGSAVGGLVVMGAVLAAFY